MSVVVVVPTYCEYENLQPLVAQIHQALPSAHVLVVDDASPDGTGDLADALSARWEWLHVLHRRAKDGLGRAYIAGYCHALRSFPDAEFFIQMDADLSHNPAYLPSMLEAAEDADVVVASRYVDGISIVNWSLHRLIISKLGTAYAKLVTGLPITDCTGGYKCYRAEVLRRINLPTVRANGYVFQVETSFRAWRHGFRVKDFPIIFYERRKGTSKLNVAIAFEAFRVILALGLQRLCARGAPAARESSGSDSASSVS